MMPLGLLTEGEEAEIMEIRNHRQAFHGCQGKQCTVNDNTRIAGIGIRVGKYIEIIRNGGSGPLLIKIDESRIAIGRGAAMKIFVRRKEQ
jgi:ferrous iron transport protein A